MKRSPILIHADGSCPRNPGPGGWAFVVVGIHEASGAVKQATNNTMELTAVLKALKFIYETEYADRDLIVHSDSQYVIRGLTDWAVVWQGNGWRRRNNVGKYVPVKNVELWQELVVWKRKFDSLRFQWVKGHAGNVYNERCDVLAGEAVWNLIEKS